MIPASQLAAYLREQSLELDRVDVQIAVMTLSAILSVDKPTARRELFCYPVPELSTDGSCSLVDQLAAEPYPLDTWFGGETDEARAALTDLYALLETVNGKVGADWLGVYRKMGEGRDARLVKLAYLGTPSRAEFPLTESFAEHSNNSRVGLTGWGVVIDDVALWQAEGGSYYQCDPKVKSEVCLPVLDASGRVLGILDAEASASAFFTPQRQVWLAALAIVLAGPFGQLPLVENS